MGDEYLIQFVEKRKTSVIRHIFHYEGPFKAIIEGRVERIMHHSTKMVVYTPSNGFTFQDLNQIAKVDHRLAR